MVLLTLLALLFLMPCQAFAKDGITAPSYILVEKDTFEIVAGRNYNEKLPPASTTKVMTTVLALEYLNGPEIIVPDKHVNQIPRSKLHLIPGKQYVAMDLIRGVMVESANDAAYAVGTHIAGNEDRFADLMTQKARAIGAYNTQFRNASGLYATGHYSTCYDLALILRHALSDERFMEIASSRYFHFQNPYHNTRYKNHNRFLFCFEPAIAGKTGFTKASRHCYVGAFEKDGKVYILSLLGSRDLWGDAVRILSSLYERLPSDQELRLAKAGAVTVAYAKEKSDKPDAVKKKSKKSKKSKKKASRAHEA
jgi:serine-type D-Ala-D-Ala carboxypeptidase (penicillin-binding protein 5/6)